MTDAALASRPDHLVVVADTLAQGEDWCRRVLSVAPAAGGAHPLMGTHNRVLSIASPAFPQAYLEIIAIDPQAPAPPRVRWFDMDDKDMRRAVRTSPHLAHFVAATADAAAGVRALAHAGIDRGTVVHAERPTPAGLLQWHITLRGDGQRLFYGLLPTLIQWGGMHPADALPASGVSLLGITAVHPRAAALAAAYAAIGLASVDVETGAPNLRVRLGTPVGDVVLESLGV